jgi:hypothetical protein
METTTQRILLAKNMEASKKFGDNLVEGAICLDVLDDPMVKRLIYQYDNRRYLNVKVVKRKDVTNYGKTHFIEIDQFVPSTQEQ